jgi:hypothetical protein
MLSLLVYTAIFDSLPVLLVLLMSLAILSRMLVRCRVFSLSLVSISTSVLVCTLCRSCPSVITFR